MQRWRQTWIWVPPFAGAASLVLGDAFVIPPLLLGIVLIVTVLAAVHHAELIAHKLGEPFGTFLLALAVTVIEVGLILTLMAEGKEGSATLARDTVFSAVMIILNGLLGVCILLGALRHHEQSFQQAGVSASLATVATLSVLTLVLPNFSVAADGPYYSPAQLGFVAVISLWLYVTFVSVQTVRHRDYFLPPEAAAAADPDAHAEPPSNRQALLSTGLLLVCLTEVVLLAKALAPSIEHAVGAAGLPYAVVGVVIAALVLLPESIAAARAAIANRLQTSLNLALGSALASIGLTIPAVAVLSLWNDLPLALGLDPRSVVLLFLTLLVAGTSLATARTTVLQGVVHLSIFGVFVFSTLVP